MEYYIRLTAEHNERLQTEYFNEPLFAIFYAGIAQCETACGGLTPPEAWSEVKYVLSRLHCLRPDKVVFTIYLDLLKRYSVFVSANRKNYEPRSKEKAEATTVTVMTCVMSALLQPQNLPKINERIASSILQLFLQADGSYHRVYEYLDAQQDIDENMEEKDSNPVPDINPLEGLTEKSGSQREPEAYRRVNAALSYYCCKLEREEGVVAPRYLETDEEGETRLSRLFDAVCQDQTLLELFGSRSQNTNTLKDRMQLAQSKEYYEWEAAKGNYNVKLLCNFMGMLKDEGILKASAKALSELFFTKSKATYFQPGKYMAFGTSSSAIPSEEVYNRLLHHIKTATSSRKINKESKPSY